MITDDKNKRLANARTDKKSCDSCQNTTAYVLRLTYVQFRSTFWHFWVRAFRLLFFCVQNFWPFTDRSCAHTHTSPAATKINITKDDYAELTQKQTTIVIISRRIIRRNHARSRRERDFDPKKNWMNSWAQQPVKYCLLLFLLRREKEK